MYFIKRSIFSAGLILLMVYVPWLLGYISQQIWGLNFGGMEIFHYCFLFSLVSLQFIPGFIYSFFQSKAFITVNGIDIKENKIGLYILANTLLYLLIMFVFIAKTVFENMEEIRMIVGPAIGAFLYLMTVEYILNVKVHKYNYSYITIFGLMVGCAIAYMKTHSDALIGAFLYTIIPIWQVGVTIITQFKLEKIKNPHRVNL